MLYAKPLVDSMLILFKTFLEMKRGGVLFDPKARKDVSTTWEVQLRSLPVSVQFNYAHFR